MLKSHALTDYAITRFYPNKINPKWMAAVPELKAA
jgi:hypothetical protein